MINPFLTIMKINCRSITTILSIIAVAILLEGCGFIPIDSDGHYVGRLTYDQAVSAFGKPLKTEKTSKGETLATWLAYESDIIEAIGTGACVFYIPNKKSLGEDSTIQTREAHLGIQTWMERHDPLPWGLRANRSARKGKYLHFRNLIFSSNGIAKHSAPTFKITWEKWVNTPMKLALTQWPYGLVLNSGLVTREAKTRKALYWSGGFYRFDEGDDEYLTPIDDSNCGNFKNIKGEPETLTTIPAWMRGL